MQASVDERAETAQSEAMSEMSDKEKGETGQVDAKLLEILVCPVTKGTLEYDRKAQELISRKAGLAYPIRDGVPIMLPDEARELDDA